MTPRPDSEGGHLKNMSLLYNDICPQMGDTFFGQADVSGWGTRQVLGGHFAVLHYCIEMLLASFGVEIRF
jgi:hypothetical protein